MDSSLLASPDSRCLRLTIAPDLEQVAEVRRFLECAAASTSLSRSRIYDLKLAASEAVANGMEHATAEGEIEIVAWLLADRIIIEVTNPGPFQPGLAKDTEERRRGLGLPLMVSLADQVHVSQLPEGRTRVSLTFLLQFKETGDTTFLAVPDTTIAQLDAERLKVEAALAEAEHRAAELSESEKRFRTMADAIPQLAWMANADGYIYWYNQRWYEYTGTTLPEMEGWGWQSVHDPEELPKVLDRWRESIATGQAFDMEFPLRGVDGVFRPFLTRVMPLKDAEGRVLQWFGTNTDITTRKRAEEALRASEERFRLALQHAPVSVAAQDRDLRFLWAYNQRTARPEEVVGKTDDDVFTPEDAARLVALKREVIESEREVHEQIWLTRNARPMFLDLYLEPLRDEAGRVSGVGIATVDLTPLKRAEEALRESEERYRGLFESISEAFALCEVLYDATGVAFDYRFLAVNSALEGFLGLPRDQVVEKTARAVLPNVDERAIESFGQVAATGEPAHFENYSTDLDKWFDVLVYRPALGQFAYLAQDISERKRLEEDLRRREEEARLLIRGAPAAVFEVDFRGPKFLSVNDYVCGQTGYNREELFRMGPMALLDDESQVRFRERIQMALGGEKPEEVVDYTVISKDGRKILSALTISLIYEDGRPVRALVVGHDITERKRIEGQLRSSARTLRALGDSRLALAFAADEQAYLQEVCRIVVEDCGHALVWIGYAEEAEGRLITPVAWSGFEEGYLETLRLTWNDTERGLGPTGTAVRTGQPRICRDMLTDPAFAPWQEEALKRGYASSIALPIPGVEPAMGALTIYSQQPDPFSREEVGLLSELAQDLAQGISMLRLRDSHLRVEQERERLLTQQHQLSVELATVNEALEAQNEELKASQYNRSLIEAALDPLVTIGPDGKITDVNEATIRITGRAREELVGTDFSDYFTDPESARRGYLEVFAQGSVTDYPLTIRGRDGKLTAVLYNASVYKDEAGRVLGVFAAARDITALRELEVQRSIADTLQQALLSVPETLPGLAFGHLHRSATENVEVGGDFYDLFLLPGNHLGIILGDVSGRGIEAANMAALVKNTLKAYAHRRGSPARVLADTNHMLIESTGEEQFVTAFFGLLNLNTGELKFSSAGHPPPALRGANGEVRLLTDAGPVLGLFPDATYPDAQATLDPGDLLVLYTDGLTEARRDGQMFGERRLLQYLAAKDGVPAAEVPNRLLQQALAFTGGALRDDFAVLALEFLGE